MSLADTLQLANLLIITATLGALVWQTAISNRIAKGQLMRDRFEMYWKLYEPVSDAQVKLFHLNYRDYVDSERYERAYKNNDDAARQYISVAQYYEYLGFLAVLDKMGIRDPLGADVMKLWTTDLVGIPAFHDAHNHFKKYYPAYARIVDQRLAEQ
jgi:hypothetical protein